MQRHDIVIAVLAVANGAALCVAEAQSTGPYVEWGDRLSTWSTLNISAEGAPTMKRIVIIKDKRQVRVVEDNDKQMVVEFGIGRK